MRFRALFVCTLGLLAQSAAAEEPALPTDRKGDLEALEYPTPRPARPRAVRQLGPTSESEERLEALEDGGLLVSRPLAPEIEARLSAMGVVRVQRREDVGHHTLFGGRYYRVLSLVPDSPPLERLKGLLGQNLRLVVALDDRLQAVLVDARRP